MPASAILGSSQPEYRIEKLLNGGGYRVVRLADKAVASLPILGAPSVEEMKERHRDGRLFASPAPVRATVEVQAEADPYVEPPREVPMYRYRTTSRPMRPPFF